MHAVAAWEVASSFFFFFFFFFFFLPDHEQGFCSPLANASTFPLSDHADGGVCTMPAATSTATGGKVGWLVGHGVSPLERGEVGDRRRCWSSGEPYVVYRLPSQKAGGEKKGGGGAKEKPRSHPQWRVWVDSISAVCTGLFRSNTRTRHTLHVANIHPPDRTLRSGRRSAAPARRLARRVTTASCAPRTRPPASRLWRPTTSACAASGLTFEASVPARCRECVRDDGGVGVGV